MKRKNVKLNLLHHVPYSGSLNNSIAASAPLTLSTAPSRTVFYEGMIVFTVSYTTAVAFKSFVFFSFARAFIYSVIFAFFSFISLSRNQYSAGFFSHKFVLFESLFVCVCSSLFILYIPIATLQSSSVIFRSYRFLLSCSFFLVIQRL